MFNANKRIRRDFGKIRAPIEIPNLIKIQEESYRDFLQMHLGPEDRKNVGIQAVFKSVFPINDFSGLAALDFVKYEFEPPKYDAEECLKRGLTYAAPLRVQLRLVIWDIAEDGSRSIKNVKDQDIFMGEVPLMTDKGTLIFNGTERVFVSQMQRSPGVFFTHDGGKTHSSGKLLFAAKIIPQRGFWLDFEFDAKDVVYCRIDKKRKFPVTTLLACFYNDETEARIQKALAEGKDGESAEKTGMTTNEILKLFYREIKLSRFKNGWKYKFEPALITKSIKFGYDLADARNGKVVLEAGTKITPRTAKKMFDDGLKEIYVESEKLAGAGAYLSDDILDMETGEIIAEAGDEITSDNLLAMDRAKTGEFGILFIDNVTVGAHIRNTLASDKERDRDGKTHNKTREEALFEVYGVMRPGEPPTINGSENMFYRMFFDKTMYDLSPVGRFKMNVRLGNTPEEAPEDLTVLRRDDIIKTIRILTGLRDGKGEIDDIDNLSNRRVRSVGEILENQYRIGIVRMERSIREKMSSAQIDSAMPQDLVNARPVLSAVKEFLGSSALSQFMDQDNPLSEIVHKRRVSALGPGGLTRERADFEVRDVHTTHYGRICPIETPEGQNIGLINSLASYAMINKYGFLETPYRKVANGKVTDEVTYLSAMEETGHFIAQGNTKLNKNGTFAEQMVACRHNGEFTMASSDRITLMDVSPKQVVSVAAALIPFLENDDANRALMGANMQRQAVPLIRAEAPLVGTGMEHRVATDSKAVIQAENDGTVSLVDSTRIVVTTGKKAKSASGVDIYRLQKYVRSNKDTCINQKPIVKVGDKVRAGDVIADGPSTDLGELALGRNVRVAFMPWQGYNYEDAIVVSERLVMSDAFSSVHIEEFEIMARDTKLGPEEITRDIPNVGSEVLRSLDETGVIHIGAHVKAGDILVGKVTPKGETPVTPEEKLLRTIFGEKATEVRDTSLKVPPGTEGTVIDVRMFFRRGIVKDERALSIEYMEIERLNKDRNDEKKILETGFHEKLLGFLDGKADANKEMLRAADIEGMSNAKLSRLKLDSERHQEQLAQIVRDFDDVIKATDANFDDKIEKVKQGNDLMPGVLKTVKVFIAVKRKLQIGDKMAGRHGNKGIVARVVPAEDMPYLSDGSPVDIVLNPLGVPSRMNVGQILETHLGWAAKGLGIKIGDMLEEVRNRSIKIQDLKDALKRIYGAEIYSRDIEPLDDGEIKQLAAGLSDGVPMSTPVFDGAKTEDIDYLLSEAGLDKSGQVDLYNGETGEKFDQKVTVGYMYMLKLHHLVDEKMHARSVGPYSLITQQPLGGKAQFGGQRFGEMEVWALEAFGAAYTLQEMLTVKSDDVSGRTKVYESIVRGNYDFEYGIPESFNVLVKEIRSLGLNLELKKN
ncbi:MAG: DNA-directed RNA polymerase subunit beta [Rickettsiales bacterium]|jgi:DNA-directed RNA polymerase subunit beta|nr:DNA-directed RNA polymerase subunit beta [Rickettsiales bacterium]